MGCEKKYFHAKEHERKKTTKRKDAMPKKHEPKK
jgi:hypothetical protein